MKRSPISVLLFLATLSGAGCYTILKHPDPAIDMTDDTGAQKECADCHSDADLYHLPGGYDNSWYVNYPAPWAAYYASPWWYGSDYWNGPQHPGLTPPPVEPEQRHVWTRDANASGVLPSQGGGNATVAPGTTDKPADGPPKPTKDQEQKAKKEKDRHVWGR